MSKEIKTIGVLTSGGDAPGMNAAVRAIVRAGISKGYRMMGIQRGYNGLINGEVYEMNVRSVSEIIHRGGTILYTARCLEFKTQEGQAKGLARCKELGIDALVVIGGDGSFMGARALANQGIPCIGLPGTIDNDIACSEYTRQCPEMHRVENLLCNIFDGGTVKVYFCFADTGQKALARHMAVKDDPLLRAELERILGKEHVKVQIAEQNAK